MDKGPDINAVRAFGAGIDFGRTAADYGTHRAGFPPAFFADLAARGWARPGQRALDMGTGAGTVARKLDDLAGVSVTYHQAKAEATGLPDASFDLITAGQCWHWFDRPRAGDEAARLLRPKGRAVIAHFDWLPLPGNMVQATEALILRYNPAWAMAGGTGLYPDWFADLAGAGFGGLQSFSFDVTQPYTPEAWRGRIRASAGVKASLDAAQVARFDADLAALLARDFSGDVLDVPHRVWAVSGVKR